MLEILRFTSKIEQKVRSELSTSSFSPAVKLQELLTYGPIIGGVLGVGVGLFAFSFVEPYVPGILEGIGRGAFAFGGAGLGFALTSRK